MSDFLSDFIPQFGRVLIFGDFNIHVCCSANELTNEFKGVLDSFSLTQSVNAPTHEQGHTLDPVISLGRSVSVREIVDAAISDHLPIIFYCDAPNSPARYRRLLTPSTAGEFAVAFRDLKQHADTVSLSPPCLDSLLSTFRSACSTVFVVLSIVLLPL